MCRVSIIVAVLAFCIPIAVWAVAGPAPRSYSSGGGTTECDSSGSAQHRCPVPGFVGARVVRQASHSPCTEGEAWGFDQGDPAVRVSDGCRA